MSRITSIFLFCLLTMHSTEVPSQVLKHVTLDSIVVVAVRSGFNVADFIDMVKSDTSFLRGFKNLRSSAHKLESDMTVYGKKKKVIATRSIHATQHISKNRRWIVVHEQKVIGDFYDRKGIAETYTAEIFEDVFFYRDTLFRQPPELPLPPEDEDKKGSNIEKIKKMIFNPGSEIKGVPIVGKRMAIFDDDMVKYYDYSITVESFGDSISCYVFSCKAKNDAGDQAVVKHLNTWFDRKTFNIVYRDYQLKYSGVLFDFDVNMQVTMNYLNDLLYPALIKYSGSWDVPMRKPETIDFDLRFSLLNPAKAE